MIVLLVMKSVDVLPIMHMFVHTQNSAGLTKYDSTGYGLIDIPSKTQELRDSKKKSRCCLQQFRQTFVHKCSFVFGFVQIRFVFQSLVLDTLFLHLDGVYLVVDFLALTISSSCTRLNTHPPPQKRSKCVLAVSLVGPPLIFASA